MFQFVVVFLLSNICAGQTQFPFRFRSTPPPPISVFVEPKPGSFSRQGVFVKIRPFHAWLEAEGFFHLFSPRDKATVGCGGDEVLLQPDQETSVHGIRNVPLHFIEQHQVESERGFRPMIEESMIGLRARAFVSSLVVSPASLVLVFNLRPQTKR